MADKHTELKPCPFCGGSEILVKSRKTTIVECAACGAAMFDHQDGQWRDVHAAWNRRPSPSETPE